MSAIVGIVGEGTQEDARAMAMRMPHRGNSLQCWHPSPGVVFGALEWDGERHPEISSTAFEGIIENLDTLRDLYRVPSGSAVHAIDWLLEREGTSVLPQLRGTFALARWNAAADTLSLACDQARYKCLYYVINESRIAFASEYKALLALDDVGVDVDEASLRYYLTTGRYPMDRTFVRGIQCVGPSEIVEIKGRDPVRREYWRPRVRPISRSRGEHSRMVRERLLDIVDRQAGRYERIGITLSGGFDAAALAAALRAVRPATDIVSFVIGYGPNDPEIIGARTVAEHVRAEHHEVIYNPRDLENDLSRLVWLMEDCGGRDEGILQMRVLQYTGSHVNVVMGGHGSDRLFGGMPRHKLVRLAELMPWFENAVRQFYLTTQTGVIQKSKLAQLGAWLKYRDRQLPPPVAVDGSALEAVAWNNDLNRFLAENVMNSNTNNYLEPSHEAARARFHTPFLDPDMIDLAFSIPSRLKIGLRGNKLILRDAFIPLLPESIRRRPKAIQALAADAEIDETIRRMSEMLLPKGWLERTKTIDRNYRDEALRSMRQRPVPRSVRWRVWPLVCFELWVRHFVDGRGFPLDGIR